MGQTATTALGHMLNQKYLRNTVEKTPILKVKLIALIRCTWGAIVSVYSYLNHHKKKILAVTKNLIF